MSPCTYEKPTTDECPIDQGTIVCNSIVYNANDYTQGVMDDKGNIMESTKTTINKPLWSCKPNNFETDASKVAPTKQWNVHDAPYFDPVYSQIACTFPGKNISSPDDHPQTMDYIVYSKIGNKITTQPTGSSGGWIYPTSKTNVTIAQHGNDIKTCAVKDIGTNISSWKYAYVPPGRQDIKNAVMSAGFFQPFGCMFAPASFAPDTQTPDNDMQNMLGDSNSGQKISTGNTCNSKTMTQLQTTCKKIGQQGTATKGSMCEQIKKDQEKFQEKLKALQNQTPWYKTLIKTGGGILSDESPSGLVKNLGIAIHKAIGAGNESVQKLNNALSINIDINQTQQSQSFCLNNAVNIQNNTLITKVCPDPYPELINNVCGLPPCKPCEARTGKPDSQGVRACEQQPAGFVGETCVPGSNDNGKATIGPDTDACQNICNIAIKQTDGTYEFNPNGLCSGFCDGLTPSGGCNFIDKTNGPAAYQACMNSCQVNKDNEYVCMEPQQANQYLYKELMNTYENCRDNAGKEQITELMNKQSDFQSSQQNVTTVLDITQSSNNKINQQCNQDVAQKALTNFAAGINNQIQQLIQQKAKNMSASNTSSMDICNDIKVNESACNYQSTQACCSNTVNSQQNNTIELTLGCSKTNGQVHQDLQATENQLCTQSVKQTAVAKGTAQITNKIKQAAAQTAVGLDPMALFIIIVIIIGIILLSPVGLAFVVGTKIILIIGIIMLLIGVCQLPAYFITKYTGESRKNTPFIFTSRKETQVQNYQDTTWKQAFDTYQNDDTIQGFDFFPNCIILPNYEQNINCTTDIASGYQSYPDSIQKGNTYIYPDDTPGKAIWYKTVAKDVKSGRSCLTRGNLPDGSDSMRDVKTDPQYGGKMYNPYICNVTGFPNSKPTFKDPTENGNGIPKSCVKSGSNSCLMPSVSYVKDYSLPVWLYSAIVTIIIGITMTGIGIWIESTKNTTKTSSQSTTKFNSTTRQTNRSGGTTRQTTRQTTRRTTRSGGTTRRTTR
jgi:hypothetical protein